MQQSIETDDYLEVLVRAEERLLLASQRLNSADCDDETLIDLAMAELDPDKKSPTDVWLLARCMLKSVSHELRAGERLPKLRRRTTMRG